MAINAFKLEGTFPKSIAAASGLETHEVPRSQRQIRQLSPVKSTTSGFYYSLSGSQLIYKQKRPDAAIILHFYLERFNAYSCETCDSDPTSIDCTSRERVEGSGKQSRAAEASKL